MISIVKLKQKKIIEKSIEIALDSSSHGIPNMFRNEKTCLKLMWIMLFLTGTSMGIYTCVNSIFSYFNYEVVTSINVINEIPTEFPAITFFIQRNNKVKISLNKLINECKFNTLSCNVTENYFKTNRDKYGFISYTFKNENAFLGGKFFALSVSLNLENITFDNGSIYDGIRLIIHNSSYDSNYYTGASPNGFNLETGFKYEISIKKIFTYKLGQPYNNCLKDVESRDSFDSDLYRYILKSTNYSYRQEDCFMYYVGRELYKHFNGSNKIDRWENIVFEYPSYSDYLNIIYQNIINNKIYKVYESECPLECDSIKYEISHSFNKFSIKNETSSSSERVQFSVYYEKPEYTVIDQIAQMTVFDLISNIGGNLGLFIGISFLSFAEIIELLVEIIFIIFNL
jgi:hypothetical protein